jgi:hypothetical protein
MVSLFVFEHTRCTTKIFCGSAAILNRPKLKYSQLGKKGNSKEIQ